VQSFGAEYVESQVSQPDVQDEEYVTSPLLQLPHFSYLSPVAFVAVHDPSFVKIA
jgi:hypothetical protein